MMAMASADDEKQTKEELERALALDENHVATRIALAKMAFASQSIPEFEQHLAKLSAIAPDNPNVMLLQAVDEQRKGNNAAALALASKTFEMIPSGSTLIVLASYQTAMGDKEAAHKGYREWLAKNPDDVAVHLAFANSLQLSQQEEEAGVHYAAALSSNPNDPIALNNMAWIVKEKDPTLALEYAKRALALAPKSAEVMDTLAVVEYYNKDYERAARTIERALQGSPDNPSLLYHSAMIAAALDDNDAARATLEKVLATNQDFPEIAEARALLARLGN